ncbi:MAG: hypothetical protein WC010_01370 [Candidatus Absconditabacterales bacterium]
MKKPNINKNISDKNNIKDLPRQDKSLFDTLTDGEEQIIEIKREDIPKEVIVLFEGYSRLYILPEEYKEGNFEQYGYIKHTTPTSFITYFALQEKTIDKKYKEKQIYLFERDKKGNKIGHGEIRLGIEYKKKDEDFFKDKPFVGFTDTEDDYKNKGYGKKRIQTMNMISKQTRGLKLHSDVLFSDPNAQKIRERLEKEGLAKRYKRKNGRDRFCFVG